MRRMTGRCRCLLSILMNLATCGLLMLPLCRARNQRMRRPLGLVNTVAIPDRVCQLKASRRMGVHPSGAHVALTGGR